MNFKKFTIITEEGELKPVSGIRARDPNEPKESDPSQVDLLKGQEADLMSAEEVRQINQTRPGDTEPIPDTLIEKYAGRIGDVWWHAKGRNGPEGDPTIGIEVNGIRKTFGGYVWNEWWYFQKTVHKSENPEESNKCYWYRKRKVPDPVDPEQYETLEEYVGAKLKDPDTALPIDVPRELQHDAAVLCPDE